MTIKAIGRQWYWTYEYPLVSRDNLVAGEYQLKKMIFAIAAFGLFAVESFIDYLEDVVPILDTPYIDILLAIISLTILILFFLAFIKRK